MSDYISREELLRRINSTVLCSTHEAREIIDSIPSADVRPSIHGHWIDKMNDYLGYVTHCECSVCGHTFKKIYADEYIGCPYCLADMREPKGEKGTE